MEPNTMEILAEVAAAVGRDPATAGFLRDLADEVRRARAKFPRNEHLTAALMEEVGELAQVLLQGQGAERVRAEALQVACVALRIATEGDADFEPIPDMFWNADSADEPLEPAAPIEVARQLLQDMAAGLGDTCTLMTAQRLPNRTYRVVSVPEDDEDEDFVVEEVPY